MSHMQPSQRTTVSIPIVDDYGWKVAPASQFMIPTVPGAAAPRLPALEPAPAVSGFLKLLILLVVFGFVYRLGMGVLRWGGFGQDVLVDRPRHPLPASAAALQPSVNVQAPSAQPAGGSADRASEGSAYRASERTSGGAVAHVAGGSVRKSPHPPAGAFAYRINGRVQVIPAEFAPLEDAPPGVSRAWTTRLHRDSVPIHVQRYYSRHEPVHVCFNYVDLRPDQRVEAIFHAVEGGDHDLLAQLPPIHGSGYSNFVINPDPEGWRPGVTHIWFKVDGKRGPTVDFVVNP